MAKNTAKKILKDSGLGFEHALYSKTGNWYHLLERFPGALLDERGYISFQTEEEYRLFATKSINGQVYENREKNTLIIKGGIANYPGYVLFSERFVFPEQVAPINVIEGAILRITVNRYERDARARNLCLAKWGVACTVCGLSFSHVYGTIGEGFIHVHHLIPISSIKGEYTLVPERDLRPVCPNCHAILHRKEPPYSIEELRDIIGKLV